jgi:hypothetical protein
MVHFITALVILLTAAHAHSARISSWDMPEQEARKLYLGSAGSPLAVDASYIASNQILSHIAAINPEVLNRMEAYRSADGTTDILLIAKKPFCVTVKKFALAPEYAEKEANAIRKDYPAESLKQENNITTYTLSDTVTQVLLSIRDNGRDRDLRVYYYPKDLFSRLIRL